mmetsp:Transcript_37152/g.83226  ORF Transcript_37152/g.83226 Transcript_37152/m.83226 type:complete len:345 (+) Transcript_37152:1500-2534(+)
MFGRLSVEGKIQLADSFLELFLGCNHVVPETPGLRQGLYHGQQNGGLDKTGGVLIILHPRLPEDFHGLLAEEGFAERGGGEGVEDECDEEVERDEAHHQAEGVHKRIRVGGPAAHERLAGGVVVVEPADGPVVFRVGVASLPAAAPRQGHVVHELVPGLPRREAEEREKPGPEGAEVRVRVVKAVELDGREELDAHRSVDEEEQTKQGDHVDEPRHGAGQHGDHGPERVRALDQADEPREAEDAKREDKLRGPARLVPRDRHDHVAHEGARDDRDVEAVPRLPHVLLKTKAGEFKHCLDQEDRGEGFVAHFERERVVLTLTEMVRRHHDRVGHDAREDEQLELM